MSAPHLDQWLGFSLVHGEKLVRWTFFAFTLKVGSRMHQLESSSNALGLWPADVASVRFKLA